MSEKQELVLTKIINAPANLVYNAFTSSVALESWFADFAEATAAEGGRFYAWWNAGHYASGLFKKLEENKLISISWRGQGEPFETHVDIIFDEENNKTQLTLKHGGLGITDQWKASIKAIKSGWEYALKNLQSVFESGLDIRLYERPML